MKYTYRIPVRYCDVDKMGIVHNSVYQVYFEEARIDLVRSGGYPYSRMEDEGFVFPLSEVNINYKSPIRYGDVVLVEVSTAYVKNFSFKFNYSIIKEDGSAVCTGHTTHAVMDYKSREFCELPSQIRKVMEKYVAKSS
ncbi:MAG: acyl-CoA thioesterase [Proteobacteria bacterium]|nr:acyl-CoA thioesterase [Pseudomonadota bacterium]